uniref:Uncharacterized protein n=1 Tax=viral metagenome TaxID=1070528 RepID=A0A6C0LYU1_9ZZZZ
MNKIFFNEIYIHMVTITLILLYSIISSLYILLNDDYNIFLRIFVIFIIAAVVVLMMKKETFLPFLGLAHLPNTLIAEEKIPNGANISYSIDMNDYEDGTKIIYWAANKTDKIIEDPYEAYKNYNNVGVTKVKNGKAEVRIFCPDRYKVKKVFTQLLERHFHYRIVFKDTGFLSPVMTVKVDC